MIEAVLDFWREGDLRGLGKLKLGLGPLRWGRTGRWCGRWRADGDGFYFDARRGCFGYCGCGSWCFGFRFWFDRDWCDGGGVAQAVDRLW